MVCDAVGQKCVGIHRKIHAACLCVSSFCVLRCHKLLTPVDFVACPSDDKPLVVSRSNVTQRAVTACSVAAWQKLFQHPSELLSKGKGKRGLFLFQQV